MGARLGVRIVASLVFPVLAVAGAGCAGSDKTATTTTIVTGSTTAVPTTVATTALPTTAKPATTAPPTTAVLPATTKPATSGPVKVVFTAQQAKGSGGAGEQFETYSGTATPGETVRVRSPYGKGEVVADAAGRWEVKVLFSGAPLKESFIVEAAATSGTQSFSWTRTA